MTGIPESSALGMAIHAYIDVERVELLLAKKQLTLQIALASLPSDGRIMYFRETEKIRHQFAIRHEQEVTTRKMGLR